MRQKPRLGEAASHKPSKLALEHCEDEVAPGVSRHAALVVGNQAGRVAHRQPGALWARGEPRWQTASGAAGGRCRRQPF
eukprot:2306657-Alexandrium_andersonii.AAC.1